MNEQEQKTLPLVEARPAEDKRVDLPGRVESAGGTVIHLPRRHVRASTVQSEVAAGRGTSAGQSQSSGQRSENQTITSSYLRAVKVLAPSSSRSKKRQSPAAKRPIVATLTERAEEYADAQAMRFERSSDSMEGDDSRKIPTNQAPPVGNILLAESDGKSDKSAMPTADQTKEIIRRALAEKGFGEISVVTAMRAQGLTGVDRTNLSDFLKGKKRSLSLDFAQDLADFLGLDVQDLRVAKRPTPTPKARFFIKEHMDARGWDDEALARRIDGIPASVITKWRSDTSKLKEWQIDAFLHAFGIEKAALMRPPVAAKGRKSA